MAANPAETEKGKEMTTENNGNGMLWVAIIQTTLGGGSYSVNKYRSRAVIDVAKRFVTDFGSIFDLDGKEATAIVFPIQKGQKWEYLDWKLTVEGKPVKPERELIDLPKTRKNKKR